MKKRCNNRRRHRYILLVAFGVGLLVASFCPPRFLIVILSGTVIVLGFVASK